MLIGQMTRFREDDRFKSVTPESMVTSRTSSGVAIGAHQNPVEQEGEIWFDWAFVDFWKSNHCESVSNVLVDGLTGLTVLDRLADGPDTVQRGLSSDPNVLSPSASSSSGTSFSAPHRGVDVIVPSDDLVARVTRFRPQRRVCHVDQLATRRNPYTSDRDGHAPSAAQSPLRELFHSGTFPRSAPTHVFA